jgi:hypothetical protein
MGTPRLVNDEYYTPAYAVTPLLKYVSRDTSVWCPFDKEHSLIVKELKNHGCRVSHTHIDDGDDFFATEKRSDVIISNPPFSKKTEVLDRLFSMSNPFAMLFGIDSIFDTKERFKLFKSNSFDIMILNARIHYHLDYTYDLKNTTNSRYLSIWVTRNVLPNRIVFEEIEKKDQL